MKLKPAVQALNRKLDLSFRNQARNLDLRSSDEQDIDPRFGKKPEHLGSDARMMLHAHADDTDLGEVFIFDDIHALKSAAFELIQHLTSLERVGLADRKTHGDFSVRRN